MKPTHLKIITAGCIWISTISLLTGCSDTLQNDPPLHQGAVPVHTDKQTTQPDVDASELARTLVLRTDEFILTPGTQETLGIQLLNAEQEPIPYDLDQFEFTVEPSTNDLIIDASGNIEVSEQAEIGDVYTLSVKYEQLFAQAEVTIKYALETTITMNEENLPVVTNPESKAVVVNKQRALPADYVPNDLVVPNVPFSFDGESEKKYLRKEAAKALELLFAQAEADGIELFGVSGYRSYNTQSAIFNYNVQTQGEEEARRFSAFPGQSEHQTGLSIDVSSRSANLSLEQIFGETEEGKWLAEHAADFGFIIRYPEGKEHITGYAYEPWHIRYVGKSMAEDIMQREITLEEYFQDAVPVNN